MLEHAPYDVAWQAIGHLLTDHQVVFWRLMEHTPWLRDLMCRWFLFC